MKVHLLKIIIGSFCYLGLTLSLVSSEPLPTEPVPPKFEAMWVNKDLDNLSEYIGLLESNYPRFVPTIVALAFRDANYLGKSAQAKQRLVALQVYVDAHPQGYSDKFRGYLEHSIFSLNMELQVHAQHGSTEADIIRMANPRKRREAWRQGLDPILDMMHEAPSLFLPVP